MNNYSSTFPWQWYDRLNSKYALSKPGNANHQNQEKDILDIWIRPEEWGVLSGMLQHTARKTSLMEMSLMQGTSAETPDNNIVNCGVIWMTHNGQPAQYHTVVSYDEKHSIGIINSLLKGEPWILPWDLVLLAYLVASSLYCNAIVVHCSLSHTWTEGHGSVYCN